MVPALISRLRTLPLVRSFFLIIFFLFFISEAILDLLESFFGVSDAEGGMLGCVYVLVKH